MSGVHSLPAMRQQFGGPMVFERGRALQQVLEMRVGVMPVKPGALGQAHDRSRTLARPHGARE